MLYSLPNGKVVEISVEQYLDITDEELEYLVSLNFGEHIENPFFGSSLDSKIVIVDDDDEFDQIINESTIIIEEEDTEIDYEAPSED